MEIDAAQGICQKVNVQGIGIIKIIERIYAEKAIDNNPFVDVRFYGRGTRNPVYQQSVHPVRADCYPPS